ncbi:MAG: serine dehydratase subunit alpha family protein [Filifactoraceae bacterium]
MSYTDILRREVVPALGCTEPIAIALATATAKVHSTGELKSIKLIASKNIIKNAMGVGIPKTNLVGIDLAMALGYINGDASKGLEVLENISEDDIKLAKKIVESGVISTDLSKTTLKLYIEVILVTTETVVKVILKDSHSNIVYISKDEKVIFEKNISKEVVKVTEEKLSLEEIYKYVTNVDIEEIKFMLDGPDMNVKISEDGLDNHYGLEIGRTIKENVNKGYLSDDMMNYAIAMTVAATDARMAGSSLPVMSTSGSGNQGIIATLPIYAIGKRLDSGEEKLSRAIALSHLMTFYIKGYLGRLSALCGCGVAAGIGSSCGITYLLGGSVDQVGYAVKNMIGDVAGMVCDGAKTGCSLKASSCTYAAIRSALMAMDDNCVSAKDGIVAESVEQSIKNLSRLANEGMENADAIMLDIMLNK